MMIKEEMSDLMNMSSDSSRSSHGSNESRDSFQLRSFNSNIINNNNNNSNSNNNNGNNNEIKLNVDDSDEDSHNDGSNHDELDDLRETLSRDSTDSQPDESSFKRHAGEQNPLNQRLTQRLQQQHQQSGHEQVQREQHQRQQQQFSQHLQRQQLFNQAQHIQQAFQQQQHQAFQYQFGGNNGPLATSNPFGNASPTTHLLQPQAAPPAVSTQNVLNPQQQQPQQQPQPQPHPQQPAQQQSQQQQQQQQSQQLGPDGKPKRNPYCSRCRNHGKSAQVKGHKRHCEYRDCQCDGCKLVECRQIVSAAQIKRRRYQKQDEECGRRIEISPPVLTRTVSSDPATLIAKTLIGSSKHGGSSKSFAAASAVASVVSSPSNQLRQFPDRLLPAAPGWQSNTDYTAASLTAAAVAASSTASSTVNSITTSGSDNHTSGGNSRASHGSDHSKSNNVRLPLPVAPLAPPMPPAPLRAELSHPLNSVANLNQHLAPQLQAGTSLSDALNLFQFPTSYSTILSAAFNQHSRQHLDSGISSLASSSTNLLMAGVAAGVGRPSSGTPGITCGQPAPSVPGIREQFSIVEELHQTYGPLAIYAWLRSEGFNVGKVRTIIDLAKLSFDELLQINGHSPLDLTSPIVDL